MAFKFTESSNTTKMIIIGEFLLVAYLLFTLTSSVYKSYQIDVHIENFEKENARIEEENRRKSEDYDYYSSNAYIEKIAKQNLGLVNPGEEVIIIPKEAFDETSETGIANNAEEAASTYAGLSNARKWWKFFFDKSQ